MIAASINNTYMKNFDISTCWGSHGGSKHLAVPAVPGTAQEIKTQVCRGIEIVAEGQTVLTMETKKTIFAQCFRLLGAILRQQKVLSSGMES